MDNRRNTTGDSLESSRKLSAAATWTHVYFQDLCYRHRYVRSRDTSLIFERPERLRAIKVGLAAALSRLEQISPSVSGNASVPENHDSSSLLDENDLAAAVERMKIVASDSDMLRFSRSRIGIVQSDATIDVLKHPAVKFVHGDIDRDVYLENLVSWVKSSQEKISAGACEIPEGLSPTDLYLCPGSLDAIQGAIGTVCEAVDGVLKSTRSPPLKTESALPDVVGGSRAFVAIRPPGHHCGEDTPSGFCFVNNVAIAAAHAHLQHSINRVVIFDIDLHHGNGTQSILWQINEETYRLTLETEQDQESAPKKPGLQIFYGSLHDILSYPCEDGKADLVQAASVSIHGAHGQHIENIHLQPYTSEEHFWDVLYPDYCQLLTKAEAFLKKSSSSDDVLVLISCGFDACEHEFPAMSRHGRKVPTSFYYRFTKDAVAFADRHAQGRVISVLEGGYSDRALTSGAMAHLCGLANIGKPGTEVDENWWSVPNLETLEQATKKRRGNQPRPFEPWVERTMAILSDIDVGSAQYLTASSRNANLPPPTSMTLRERKKPGSADPSPAPSPAKSKAAPKSTKTSPAPTQEVAADEQKDNLEGKPRDDHEDSSARSESEPHIQPEGSSISTKKLPRVILRLGPPPDKVP